ncbi:MAG TPA: hypothetical protein VN843_22750, partial [Anaerolineales bacterium]|nr:hypothetical protein [Anaerolineales bacterium]
GFSPLVQARIFPSFFQRLGELEQVQGCSRATTDSRLSCDAFSGIQFTAISPSILVLNFKIGAENQ